VSSLKVPHFDAFVLGSGDQKTWNMGTCNKASYGLSMGLDNGQSFVSFANVECAQLPIFCCDLKKTKLQIIIKNKKISTFR
jgi:hypothetical protein